jgi:hypothetical protein
MSLKKQVKEIKQELMKREEDLHNLKRHVKTTRLQELEQENALYKDELFRLRYILEANLSDPNSQQLARYASSGDNKMVIATSGSEATSKGIDGALFNHAQSHEFGSTQNHEAVGLTSTNGMMNIDQTTASYYNEPQSRFNEQTNDLIALFNA